METLNVNCSNILDLICLTRHTRSAGREISLHNMGERLSGEWARIEQHGETTFKVLTTKWRYSTTSQGEN